MSFIDICYSTFANKCPRCHAARVFKSNNAYSYKNGLKMYTHCASCGLKYEREVGYFYGAMYISYAVQTIIVSVMWALSLLWLNMDAGPLIFTIIGITVAIFPLNFRWSRIMWIAFFTPFDKNYKGHAWVE